MEEKLNWAKELKTRLTLAETLRLSQEEASLRQEQGKDITKDDLINLKIDLGTCNSVEEFLGRLEEA
jgi:hypothetical protein